MLKSLAVAICLALPVVAVQAQERKEMTTQQKKMGACNKEAGEKKLAGDERKAFMKECLSARAQTAKNPQQEKMRTCTRTAGEKKLAGDARKKFMSDCLSA